MSVINLTVNLADELGRTGVTVNVVHPGMTYTEGLEPKLKPRADALGLPVKTYVERIAQENVIGRLVTALDVASVVTFLSSAAAAALTGVVVPVTGGTGGAIYY